MVSVGASILNYYFSLFVYKVCAPLEIPGKSGVLYIFLETPGRLLES